MGASLCGGKQETERLINVDASAVGGFPDNGVSNTKYNIITFVPLVLYNQFKYFFNFYFLAISLSQFIDELKVGFLFTYVCPLAFVLLVTMIREAVEDLARRNRDNDVNNKKYFKLNANGGGEYIRSIDIRVGHILQINKDEVIPADMILLKTTEESGSIFLRTDQLDGETDWKHRNPIAATQACSNGKEIVQQSLEIIATPPSIDIYVFEGVCTTASGDRIPLDHSNTMWSSTALASHDAIGLVIYTGKDTRSVMNSRKASQKFGICDSELNRLGKLLFISCFICACVLLILAGFHADSASFFLLCRYMLLMSSIIPISLRVNLDLAKLWYSWKIDTDKEIEGTVAKNTNIAEELGRIQILLTDKTGTLTKNIMTFNKIIYDRFLMENDPAHIAEHAKILKENCSDNSEPMADIDPRRRGGKRGRDFMYRDLVTALILCHNVTPVMEDDVKELQGSSPDEVSLVKHAEEMGYELLDRKENFIRIRNANGDLEEYDILQNFPFTSAKKRMGIIVQHRGSGKIIFYLKGAEDVIQDKVNRKYSGEIIEKCTDLAREGLRTLVITQKLLIQKEYEDWQVNYSEAETALQDRENRKNFVIESLENEMEYLGVTGVEDALQDNVRGVIHNVRESNIAVWMLTGDKMETAKCISISTGIKDQKQEFFEFAGIHNLADFKRKIMEFKQELEAARDRSVQPVLVIEGSTLATALHDSDFLDIANLAPAVICCRVSPTQKTSVVEALQYTNKRICCIGDGGNDVGMIQAAHVGIGIIGKEGMQAALASDFSIVEFNVLQELLLWHGRLSYFRTAKLSQFVFHRGLIISVIQAIFISLFFFAAIPIYNGMLMLGYSTIYTMLPVFSLVLDQDIDRKTVHQYPILYRNLAKGRMLSITTFCDWVAKSVYQGSVIILLGLILFEETSFTNIIAITFTSLVLTEWLNIGTEIHKWHKLMFLSIFGSVLVYALTIVFLSEYFDIEYIYSVTFVWKVLLITACSWGPTHAIRFISAKIWPSDESKLSRQSNINP